jgi:hypothetical protein
MPASHDQPTLPIDEPELDRLLSALSDGILDAEDRGRLEDHLLSDAGARRRYLEHMQLEFLIAAEIGFDAADTRPEQPRRGSGLPPAFRGGAAAAVLVGAMACAAWWGAGRWAALPTARVTAVQDAVWEGDRQPGVGSDLASGPVRLVRGSAQITLRSGAVVAVHAPAAVEVLGANRLFLRSGRITPYVPPAATGFTVVSPSGEVVDFGTEFSIGVGDDGKTDVFVIDGEVSVAGGHGTAAAPMHLTQGFATRFASVDSAPKVTLQPLVIDHFDSADGLLLRRDCDVENQSAVRDGRLCLPIDGRPHRDDPMVQMIIDNDLSLLAGRRSVISYKATLPDNGAVHKGRWVALVIDDGTKETPPPAPSPSAQFGIMVSPLWQVGLRVGGQVPERRSRDKVFSRAEDRVGPYQVVLEIDDSPAARAAHGSAVVTAMVNGLEILRNQPLDLPARPRFSFQTWVRPHEGGVGQALIDDFSVSVDSAADRESQL